MNKQKYLRVKLVLVLQTSVFPESSYFTESLYPSICHVYIYIKLVISDSKKGWTFGIT